MLYTELIKQDFRQILKEAKDQHFQQVLYGLDAVCVTQPGL